MKAFNAPGIVPVPNGFTGRLTPAARDRLLALGVTRRFRAGEFLLREGERSDHVFLLIHGRVKIMSTAENGYAVVLGIRGPGDLVGEMAGLDGSPRSATVTALDPVLARIIPGSDFHRFIGSQRGAGFALAELIASRLRAANRRRLEFAAFPVQRRLALVLLDLERWYGVSAADDPNHRDIDLALSQLDLAGLAGSSLDSVAKAVRDLARQGIVRTRRRHLTILDRSALAKVAGEFA
jgi:CRP/FNR family transcriptional regulator, cyclic AMP receptor protein